MTYQHKHYPAMSMHNYSAFCNAYVICFANDGMDAKYDVWAYNYAVKAGMVFG